MQLSDKSGICCDQCNISYRNDFTYYSFDFIPIVQYRPPLEHLVNINPTQSIDICDNCYDKLTELIVENNKKKGRNQYCEITGSNLGNKYQYCIVTKATVKLSDKQSDVIENKRCLEFNLTESVLQQWLERAKTIKQQAEEWTTKS